MVTPQVFPVPREIRANEVMALTTSAGKTFAQAIGYRVVAEVGQVAYLRPPS